MFKAHCARGHERVDFTDRAAFTDHMTIDHGAKVLLPGSASQWNEGQAPGWSGGRISAPYAWAAPRRTPGGIDRVARDLEAGKYDMPLTYTGPVLRMGEAVA